MRPRWRRGCKGIYLARLFHRDAPDTFVRQIFTVMNRADWHVYRVRIIRASKARLVSKSDAERGVNVHLFVRRSGRIRGITQKFYYAGTLEFIRWEGEQPITVWWRLNAPMPDRLWTELGEFGKGGTTNQ